MREKIFWDTWAFISLADKGNLHHQQAKTLSKALQSQHTMMVTTQAVLTEVGNAFSKRQIRHLAIRQIEGVRTMLKQELAQIVMVNTALWERAWELYHARPDKDWGHTDCISFVVMQELGISKAFTGDKHFEQAGFTRLVQV